MRRRVWAGLWVAVLCAFAGGSVRAGEAASAADVLPGDAQFVLHLKSAPVLALALATSDFGQLMLEPEMQAFLQPALERALEEYKAAREQQPWLPDLKDLAAAFSGDVGVTVTVSKGAKEPAVAFAAQVGDAKALERILKTFLAGNPLKEGEFIGFAGAEGPGLLFEKGLLLGAGSKAELDKLRARLADPAKRADALSTCKHLADGRKLLGGDGHLTLSLDAAALLKMLQEMIPADQKARMLAFIEKSGVDGLQGVALQVGQRKELFTFDLAVGLDGAPKGLFAALTANPTLPAAVLKCVPEQCNFCSVANVDAVPALALLRALHENPAELEAALGRFKNEFGVDLEKDLLTPLSGPWLTYDSGGSEMFGLLPSLALCVETKGPEQAKRAADALLKLIPKSGRLQGPLQYEMKEVKLGDVNVHYLTLPVLSLSPAIAVKDQRVFLTLSVNGMRRALAQLGAEKDLSANKDFQAALAHVTGKPFDPQALPGQFNFQNAPKDASAWNSLAQIGHWIQSVQKLSMQFGGGRRQEPIELIFNELDFALIPGDATFMKHVKPAAGALLKVDGGVVMRSDISLTSPLSMFSGSNSVGGVAVIAALAVPNLTRSRMAANESAAIAACKTFAEAQEIYIRTDYNGDGVKEYAQCIRGGEKPKEVPAEQAPKPTEEDIKTAEALIPKLAADDFTEREMANEKLEKMGPKIAELLEKASKEAKDAEIKNRAAGLAKKLRAQLVKHPVHDTGYGLYTDGAAGATAGNLSLVDAAFANAEGAPGVAQPRSGYIFKVLYKQGDNAPGGKKNYIVNGHMTDGYALLAIPAKYDSTGRNTFVINDTGQVYQKDMGKEATEKAYEQMEEFNPDNTWTVSE